MKVMFYGRVKIIINVVQILLLNKLLRLITNYNIMMVYQSFLSL